MRLPRELVAALEQPPADGGVERGIAAEPVERLAQREGIARAEDDALGRVGQSAPVAHDRRDAPGDRLGRDECGWLLPLARDDERVDAPEERLLLEGADLAEVRDPGIPARRR